MFPTASFEGNSVVDADDAVSEPQLRSFTGGRCVENCCLVLFMSQYSMVEMLKACSCGMVWRRETEYLPQIWARGPQARVVLS